MTDFTLHLGAELVPVAVNVAVVAFIVVLAFGGVRQALTAAAG